MLVFALVPILFVGDWLERRLYGRPTTLGGWNPLAVIVELLHKWF